MKKLLITSVFFLGVIAGVSDVRAEGCPMTDDSKYYKITTEDWDKIVTAYTDADDDVKAYADGLVAKLSGDVNAKLGDLDFSTAQNIAQKVTYIECSVI